ncbi:hypothetical protein ABZ695_05765 [Streptomyces sp. NPDC006976]|uniref:hypothetical protein n=1 Tax=Streptomyces sp. NPDC006976 TaxID=3154311 RepID=UPI0033FEDABB
MSARTPQETATHALGRAVEFADKAAAYTNYSANSTEVNAPLIAALGGLAGVYADIAKAAALTARNA